MDNRSLAALENSYNMLNALYNMLPPNLKNMNDNGGKELWNNFLAIMVENEAVIHSAKDKENLYEAAPDMLEALQSIILYHSDKETGIMPGHKLGGTLPFLKAQTAIRKATGKLS